jgi:hypothetical protein
LPIAGEPVVERQREQHRRDRGVALEDRDLVLGEDLAHDAHHHGRDVRRHLGRLQDRGVARRDRADQRAERQVHVVVPRRDDQAAALGLVLDPRLQADGQARRPDALRLHPFLERALRVLGFADDRQDLGEVHLGGRLAEVLPGGLVELRPARHHGVVQPHDLRDALGGGGTPQPQGCLPLTIKNPPDFGFQIAGGERQVGNGGAHGRFPGSRLQGPEYRR